MQDQQLTLSSQAIVAIVTVIVLIVAIPVGRYIRRHRALQVKGASVLLSYYAPGKLLPLATDQMVQGLRYAAYAAGSTGALLYRIELPFITRIHLLAIPKGNGVEQLDPASTGSLMERVELEGDYGNYFSLFAEHGQQQAARYVIDPATMAFTVEFCRSHNWEIIDDELYFLQATPDNPADPTDMFDDITRFIAEIRPAVELPVSAQDLKNASPYGEDRRPSLRCPICHRDMPNTDSAFVCGQGHGALVTARQLLEHRLPPVPAATPAEHGPLTCPSCGSAMERTDYNGRGIQIDSCMQCQYRWLDADELAKV